MESTIGALTKAKVVVNQTVVWMEMATQETEQLLTFATNGIFEPGETYSVELWLDRKSQLSINAHVLSVPLQIPKLPAPRNTCPLPPPLGAVRSKSSEVLYDPDDLSAWKGPDEWTTWFSTYYKHSTISGKEARLQQLGGVLPTRTKPKAMSSAVELHLAPGMDTTLFIDSLQQPFHFEVPLVLANSGPLRNSFKCSLAGLEDDAETVAEQTFLDTTTLWCLFSLETHLFRRGNTTAALRVWSEEVPVELASSQFTFVNV